MPTEQENFMAQALALAAEAAAAGEVPVGCVIVRDGEIEKRTSLSAGPFPYFLEDWMKRSFVSCKY